MSVCTISSLSSIEKRGAFLSLFANGHNQMVNQFAGTFDNMQVSLGNRVESAWINSYT